MSIQNPSHYVVKLLDKLKSETPETIDWTDCAPGDQSRLKDKNPQKAKLEKQEVTLANLQMQPLGKRND